MDRFKSILSWSDKTGELNYFFIKKTEKSIYLSNQDIFTTDLTLFLAKDINEDDVITVAFRNVFLIKFDLSLTQLAGLAIDDISNRGLEKCNYSIYTYESDDIDFNCEDIDITNNAT